MIGLLGDLVFTDSQSRNKEGVSAISGVNEDFLRGHGVATMSIPNETSGNSIRAITAPDAPELPVVTMGHRDTVFPKGEVKRRLFRIE